MRKLVSFAVIVAMLSLACFAAVDTGYSRFESVAKYSSPKTATVPTQTISIFDVAAIQADADRYSAPAIEVAAIPPDIAVEVASANTTNRTATASRTNQLRVETNTSPPSDHNGKLVGQPLDAENAYVPLGSPKPVEATARSGSYT